MISTHREKRLKPTHKNRQKRLGFYFISSEEKQSEKQPGYKADSDLIKLATFHSTVSWRTPQQRADTTTRLPARSIINLEIFPHWQLRLILARTSVRGRDTTQISSISSCIWLIYNQITRQADERSVTCVFLPRSPVCAPVVLCLRRSAERQTVLKRPPESRPSLATPPRAADRPPDTHTGHNTQVRKSAATVVCLSGLQSSSIIRNTCGSYLSLLVDDGHCVLQLDVVEQAGQEHVCHADQTVVLLLVEERVGTLEIGPHHLSDRKRENGARLMNESLVWRL